MLLLDYARNDVGLRMGGLHGGRHIGYTTDEEKANAMRDAGASVVGAGRNGQGSTSQAADLLPPATVPAWEIAFPVGAVKP